MILVRWFYPGQARWLNISIFSSFIILKMHSILFSTWGVKIKKILLFILSAYLLTNWLNDLPMVCIFRFYVLGSYLLGLLKGSNAKHPMWQLLQYDDVSSFPSDCWKNCGLKIPLTSKANKIFSFPKIFWHEDTYFTDYM